MTVQETAKKAGVYINGLSVPDAKRAIAIEVLGLFTHRTDAEIEPFYAEAAAKLKDVEPSVDVPRARLEKLAGLVGIKPEEMANLDDFDLRNDTLKKWSPSIDLRGKGSAYLNALFLHAAEGIEKKAAFNATKVVPKTDSASAAGTYRTDSSSSSKSQSKSTQMKFDPRYGDGSAYDPRSSREKQDAMDAAYERSTKAYAELQRQRRLDAGLEHAEPAMEAELAEVAARFATARERDLDLIRRDTFARSAARQQELIINRGQDMSWKQSLTVNNK